MKIIDASGFVCGRLSSAVAKMLLNGESVAIINVEKAVISGSPASIARLYKERLDRGDKYKGPFLSRLPDRMIHRMIRGMLPYKQDIGRKALRRLHVYIGSPKGIAGNAFEANFKKSSDLTSEYVTLQDLSHKLGRKPM
ncbi:MAG: 50S ribosomal protein L13 [Candidatus Aenigmatarchaeota archaeon]